MIPVLDSRDDRGLVGAYSVRCNTCGLTIAAGWGQPRWESLHGVCASKSITVTMETRGEITALTRKGEAKT